MTPNSVKQTPQLAHKVAAHKSVFELIFLFFFFFCLTMKDSQFTSTFFNEYSDSKQLWNDFKKKIFDLIFT